MTMPSNTLAADSEAEVAIFSSVEQAESAVRRLLELGFDKDHITVVCSDWNKEKYFSEFEHQEPAGTFTPQAALTGVAVGALLGGVPVIGAAVATGSAILWVAGPAAAGAFGLVGGIVGAMSTRGLEKEIANYYQQAVADGAILVAAEGSGSDRLQKLALAAKLFSELGARPLSLPAG